MAGWLVVAWLPGVLMWAGGLTVTKVPTVWNVFPLIVHLGGAPLQTQVIGHIGAPGVVNILTNIDSQQGLVTIETETLSLMSKITSNPSDDDDVLRIPNAYFCC